MKMSYLCGFRSFQFLKYFYTRQSLPPRNCQIYIYAIHLIFHPYFFKIIFKTLTLALISFFIQENSQDFIPYTAAISTLYKGETLN